MLTLSFVKHFVLSNSSLVYLLIVLGVLIEGEIVVIMAGIFIHLGALNIFVVIPSILLGAILRSVFGYSFGAHLEKEHSHLSIICWTEKKINHFLPSFSKRPFLSIFLSRFLILGMYSFALIYTGYKKINLRTFVRAEVSSFVVWTTIMLSLGYFFSYTALSVSRDINKFIGIIGLFLLGFFVLEKIVGFFIKLFEGKYQNQDVNF
jgi:membrane protein DedA with SNARE-associated domain